MSTATPSPAGGRAISSDRRRLAQYPSDVEFASGAPRAPAGVDGLVGRIELIETVAMLLGGPAPACCVVVGRSGAGRSALAAAVADRLGVPLLAGSTLSLAELDAAVGGGAPVVIDDVEALDAPSRAAVERCGVDARSRLLVTARSEPGSGWERAGASTVVASLLRAPWAHRVPLGPLGEAECVELARRALGSPVDATAGRQLRWLTGGLPALLRSLLDGAATIGRWPGAGWTPDPERARGLLTGSEGRRRWGSLGAPEREVVATVCARGAVAVADLLDGAAGAAVLRSALSSGLIEASAGSGDLGGAVPPFVIPAPWLHRATVAAWRGAEVSPPSHPSCAAHALAAALDALVEELVVLARDHLAEAARAVDDLDAIEDAGIAAALDAGQLVALGEIAARAGSVDASLDGMLRAVAGGGGARALAGVVAALGVLGELGSARRWADSYDAAVRSGAGPLDIVAERWRATLDRHDGDLDACRARLRRSLRAAVADDDCDYLVETAFDLVLVDDADGAASALARPGVSPRGVAATALAAFVVACARDRYDDAVGAAFDLGAAGARRHELEAWGHLARWAARLGDEPQRRRAARHVARLGGRGVRGWLAAPEACIVPRCSERQLQVAALAADGLSRAAIAERLYLSPKTVDRHLGAVYAALAVSGRDELAAAMAEVAR